VVNYRRISMGVQGLTEISVDAFQAPKTSTAVHVAIEA
jgi:phenylpyruvate tautomerase PptA (4-oxalocrotonate tautomerase family)